MLFYVVFLIIAVLGGLLMYAESKSPGKCEVTLRSPIVPGGGTVYSLFTCDRRKGHEGDHLDYNEQVGWPV